MVLAAPPGSPSGGPVLAKTLLSRVGPSSGMSTETLFVPPGYNSVAIEAIPESGGAPNASFTVQDSIQDASGFSPTVDTNGVMSNATVATKRSVGGVRPYVKVSYTVTSGLWTVTLALIAQPGISTTQVPGNVNVTNFPATQAVQSADGGLATIGTTGDAEVAAGNATLIALAKRLRTLLNGGLPAALDASGNLKAALFGGATAISPGTAADGMANAGVNALFEIAYNGLFNGATWDRQRGPVVFRSVRVTAAGSTPLWTPAASKKFRLMRYCIIVTGNASLAAAGILTVDLFDGATSLGQGHDIYVPAAALSGPALYWSDWVDLGNGQLSSAANNVLNGNLSAALTAGAARILSCGTEE
jgi:hypothetical protein